MSSAEIDFTFTEKAEQVSVRVRLEDDSASADYLQVKALEVANKVLSGFEESKNANI